MSFREQAREAAILRCKLPGTYTIGEVADAASDVWEQALQALISDIDELTHQHNWLIHQESYRRAKEGLK